MSLLDQYDLTLKLSRTEETERLAAASDRLLLLRLVSGGIFDGSGRLGPPVCIVFEGWDASGKGGAIKRLVSPLDPRHVRVSSFAARHMTRSVIISFHDSGPTCPDGEAGPFSTGVGTGGYSSNVSRGSPRRISGSVHTTRSRASSEP